MKPWFLLPTKMAHDIAPFFLRAYGQIFRPQRLEWQPVKWRGLEFANPIGIAGGVDKNAESVRGWWAFGAGFIEVGTVTPQPQSPNPGVILQRDIPNQALWNRMGFPSKGVACALNNLRRLKPYATPVFVNIGKNRNTPNEKAFEDYQTCLQQLSDVADAFVVNISSPNTNGLRELLHPQNLTAFLSSALANRPAKPILLKLSPDMTETEIRTTLDIAIKNGVDGFILTNTTLSREPNSPFSNEGGVSGAPLRTLAEKALRTAALHLGPKRSQLLISAGGILTSEDVKIRLDLGADLVQIYSALIYSGPKFFNQCYRQFAPPKDH